LALVIASSVDFFSASSEFFSSSFLPSPLASFLASLDSRFSGVGASRADYYQG